MNLDFYIEKFNKLNGTLNDLNREIDEIKNSSATTEFKPFEGIADDLCDNIRNFLKQLSVPLAKILKISRGLLIVSDGRIFYDGFTRSVPFDYSNAMEISEECVKQINASLKIIVNKGVDGTELKKLCYALNTLYAVYDEISILESKAKKEYNKKFILNAQEEEEKQRKFELSRKKRLAELEEKKEKVLHDLFVFNLDLSTYIYDNSYDLSKMDEDTFVEKEEKIGLVDNKFYIARMKDAGNEEFYEYLDKEKNVHLKPEGSPIYLSIDNPTLFIDAESEYLSSDYFADSKNDYFGKIIDNALLHFKSENLNFVFAEHRMQETVFVPIGNRLNAISPNYIILNKGYDEGNSLREVINKVSDIIYDRDAELKTYRYSDISEFNRTTKNPLPYILFILKDYPKSFNKSINDKLDYILRKGGQNGVFTIIIGQNIEIEGEYSGAQPIEKLDLKKYGIPKIEVKRDEYYETHVTFNGKEVEFIDFPLKGIDMTSLLKKRSKQKTKFLITDILEDNDEKVPFYERIRIPIGESNGNIIYYESSTSKRPYPFTVVTGSTGSGKSAFLHDFILSAAYKYSPDEVEIHLVDFKSADQSTDFEGYKYNRDGVCKIEGGNKYVYIPHIKFLSLKSRPENALDVSDYILKLMSERSRFGKFEEYNRLHPEKKLPQIFVIIDEYENMLKGGDSKSNDAFENTILITKVKQNITTLLKRARVFGIGVIFAGQNFSLDDDAAAQINMRYAFFNSQTALQASFPWSTIQNFSNFPSDSKEAAGYAYFSDNLAQDISFGKMAYAGSVQSDLIEEVAKRIRKKWQKYTDMHEQIVIGGASAVIPEKNSYPTWEEDIEQRIMRERAASEDEETFNSSGSSEAIKTIRNVFIGESNSSNAKIGMEFRISDTSFNYYVFGDDPTVRRIESNAILSFIYQTAGVKYGKKRVYYLDGAYKKAANEVIDSYAAKCGKLNDYIDVIDDPKKMARKILELADSMESFDPKAPTLLIMHGFDWFNNEKSLKWFESSEKTNKWNENSDKENKEFQDQIKQSGIAVSSALGDFLSKINIGQASKVTEDIGKDDKYKSFTFSDVEKAYKRIFKEGSRHGLFMIVSSNDYSELVRNVINNFKINDSIFLPVVYSSFEAMRDKRIDSVPNANNCYIVNQNYIGTVKLYDYLNNAAHSWWEDFNEKFIKSGE